MHSAVKPGQAWELLRKDLGLGAEGEEAEGRREECGVQDLQGYRPVRPEERWEEFSNRWRGER